MTEEIKGQESNIKGASAPESKSISPDTTDADLLEMQSTLR